MLLIVGLGNPGTKYAQNRHNVGFMFVEFLGKKLEAESWKLEKKYKAQVCEGEIKGEKCILMKPQTFMNLSGEAVQPLTSIFKLPSSHIFVAHDDLDIPVGKFKINQGRGPKMHNGLDSITEKIGNDYWRIRIGVEHRDPENRISGEAYVLQNIPIVEKELLDSIFEQIYQRLLLQLPV